MLSHTLPDVLQPNLDVVFCGTAVSTASARECAYYAGPGNRFWETLREIGLTPRRTLEPCEFKTVVKYGIGFTDLAKHTWGQDSGLTKGDFDIVSLRAKIERFAPRVLAFNGKKAASVFLDVKSPRYGLQHETIGDTAIFVLPSTSAAAKKFWDIGYWIELSAYLTRNRSNDR
jgi:TDG/mug DNA glycosylase family protein